MFLYGAFKRSSPELYVASGIGDEPFCLVGKFHFVSDSFETFVKVFQFEVDNLEYGITVETVEYYYVVYPVEKFGRERLVECFADY